MDPELEALRHVALSAPTAAERARLLTELKDRATAAGADDAMERILFDLLDAASDAERAELSIMAFQEILERHDRGQAGFNTWRVLWHYKWIFSDLTDFTCISRARIQALLDDFDRRCHIAGMGTKALLRIRLHVAEGCSDPISAEQFDAWNRAPRDELSDCIACDRAFEIEWALDQRRPEEALELAAPILAGTLRCRTVPQRTWLRIAIAELLLGREEAAETAFRKATRALAAAPERVLWISDCARFAMARGRMVQARHLLERALQAVQTMLDDHSRLRVHRAVAEYAERAANARGQLRLSIPATVGIGAGQIVHAAEEVRAWFRRDVLARAAAFDERNGHSHASDAIWRPLF